MNRCTPTIPRSRLGRLRRHQTGMILAIVLVTLVVVMLLGAAFANAFLAHRQRVRHNHRQQQAFWLAESALARAAYRCVNESNYQGETWQISAVDLGGKHAGVTTVRVNAVSDPHPGHQISVVANYPSNAMQPSVQYREQFVAASDEPSTDPESNN